MSKVFCAFIGIMLICLLSGIVSAATVKTPVIKPVEDSKVYIPEYCQYTNDPTVCDGDHFKVIEQPKTEPIKEIKKYKPRNTPGKKLSRYYAGHRRQR